MVFPIFKAWRVIQGYVGSKEPKNLCFFFAHRQQWYWNRGLVNETKKRICVPLKRDFSDTSLAIVQNHIFLKFQRHHDKFFCHFFFAFYFSQLVSYLNLLSKLYFRIQISFDFWNMYLQTFKRLFHIRVRIHSWNFIKKILEG